MKTAEFSVSVPTLGWAETFTYSQPETLEEYKERFGDDADAINDACALRVISMQGVVRSARTKKENPITERDALQGIVDGYRVGKREVSPASVRAVTKAAKEFDEEQRVQLAAILQMVKDNPEALEKLAKAAAKAKGGK
jgi:hypothetical protein